MNNIPGQSALQAFGIKQNVTANNIANMNTPGFKADRVSLEEIQNRQGVRVQNIANQNPEISSSSTEASSETRENGGHGFSYAPSERSDTELTREMVKMIENENAYTANASTIKVTNQMTGELLNLTT